MKKTLAICLLIVTPHLAFAKGIGPVVTPTPTGFGIKFSKDGTPLAVPMRQAGTGVEVGGTVPVAISTSVSLPVIASAIVTGTLMGGPWGAAIAGVGAVGLVAVPALLDAFNRAKLTVSSSGQIMGQSTGTRSPSCPTESTAPHSYTADTSIKFTLLCMPFTAGSTTWVYGYSKSSVDNGWPGATFPCGDGSCQSGYVWETYGYVYNASPPEPVIAPVTTAQAVDKLTMSAPTLAEVQALIDLNFPPVVDKPVLSGPASVSEFNTVKLGLDGTVEEIEKRYIASFNPGQIDITTSVTTTVKTPAGQTTTVTTNADGTPGGTAVTTRPAASSTITTTTPGTDAPKVCGLPGTPVCAVKVDETGTAEAPKLDGQKTADDILKPLKDFAADPKSKLPSLPVLNWGFALPTGCTAIAIPAFAPYLQAIDICPFLPMFHDLMSVVWVLGGLFGAIGTFWRNVFSQH